MRVKITIIGHCDAASYSDSKQRDSKWKIPSDVVDAILSEKYKRCSKGIIFDLYYSSWENCLCG